MLHEQTKIYISGLGDAELLAYVQTGLVAYEADAIAFAQTELNRRDLSPERLAEIRREKARSVALYDYKAPPDPNRERDVYAIVCERCGLEAPTLYVEYRLRTALICGRVSKLYRGHFCRRCNQRYFWITTPSTFIFGWWGVFSFFLTAMCLVDNVWTLTQSFSIPPVPPDAERPEYDAVVAERIAPHANLIVDRLFWGVEKNDIAREIAVLADVTPGKALHFVEVMRRERAGAAAMDVQPPMHGFPSQLPAIPPSQ